MLVDLAKYNIKIRIKEIKVRLIPLYVVSLGIGY
jgi:hypothetical protein